MLRCQPHVRTSSAIGTLARITLIPDVYTDQRQIKRVKLSTRGYRSSGRCGPRNDWYLQ